MIRPEEDYHKVTVSRGAATHVTDPRRWGVTLCGTRWYFRCELGTDHYCKRCQTTLARRQAETRESLNLGQPY